MMTAEQLAQFFHESYERLAPWFGYKTREESAKPWANVPEQNRKLMTAVCAEVLTQAAAHLAEKEREIACLLPQRNKWAMLCQHFGVPEKETCVATITDKFVAAEERLQEAQAERDALKELLTDMELEHSAALRQREAELEQRWIAVGEKEPPKDGREVLLTVKYRAGIPNGKLVGHWQPGGHCIQDHPPIEAGWYFWNGRMFDQASEPTHWQPLPSPPKEAK